MKMKTFRAGIFPPEHKELARDIPFRECPPGDELIYPLSQHIGKPAKAIVAKGARVLVGQRIAEADGYVSANIAASVSGTVKAVENRPGTTGVATPCIVVQNDGLYEKAEGVGEQVDASAFTAQEILARIRDAGIVGAGGAGFPTHVKLAPKNPDGVDYLFANGAECEPYICCDDQLMRSRADGIVAGLEIMLKLLPKARAVVVIEENKPEAIAAMEKACQGHAQVSVQVVRTKYPQGGERSIIAALTGRHMKPGQLPADVGCIVENVGTIYAIYRAVCFNEPMFERGFTVSGDAMAASANFIVRTGTPYSRVVEEAGGFAEGVLPEKLLSGGPMMGIAMPGLDAPICKNTNALVALQKDAVAEAEAEMTQCIRCGRCSMVCPIGLVPQLMAMAAARHEYERYEKKLYGLDCIACGTCTYNCPAKRPLMQEFRRAKAEILAAKRKEASK